MRFSTTIPFKKEAKEIELSHGDHSGHAHGPNGECLHDQAQKAEDLPKDGGRLFIGMTCKVCNTRSYHTMSKLAYNHGVVIIKCEGCANHHLIADHLGWFDSQQKMGTIEDILQRAGEGEKVTKIKVVRPLQLAPQTAKMDSEKPEDITIMDALQWMPEEAANLERARMEEAKQKKEATARGSDGAGAGADGGGGGGGGE
jgi:hypothetical protein